MHTPEATAQKSELTRFSMSLLRLATHTCPGARCFSCSKPSASSTNSAHSRAIQTPGTPPFVCLQLGKLFPMLYSWVSHTSLNWPSHDPHGQSGITYIVAPLGPTQASQTQSPPWWRNAKTKVKSPRSAAMSSVWHSPWRGAPSTGELKTDWNNEIHAWY